MNSTNDELDQNLVSGEAETDPLVCGFCCDEAGVISPLSWDDVSVRGVLDSNRWCWIHLNRKSEEAQRWLSEQGAPDSTVCKVLLQEDSRPRVLKHLNGFLLNLRGVNLNPGAEPEDMIALRIWATPQLIISTRARRILAAEDLRDKFLAGSPPRGSGAVVAFLAHRLVSRFGPVVSDLDERVDFLEDEIIESGTKTSRAPIRAFRRTVLSLRRYIAPQREALAEFLRDSDSFLSTVERHQIRETYDEVARVAEELDLIRERALLLQEQLVEERSEAMNSRLFILAVVSAIFLPLGFITGLFGVNVGGMPGVESPYAFVILCVGVLLFSLVTLLLFWKMKWI